MKCWLLLLSVLGALAAAAAKSNTGCRIYHRTYSYETQVVNGLIPHSPLRNGLKLATTVIWVKDCNDKVMVNFTDVKCFRVDQSAKNAETEMINNEVLKDIIVQNQCKALIGSLKIPFGFTYSTHGQVSDLLFDDKDLTVNIKKGFVSLFQVNFEKKLLVEDEVLKSDKRKQFTVLETSPTGLCATRYFIHSFDVGATESISLNKVRDYSRCVKATGYKSTSVFEGMEMPDNIKTDPMSHTNSIKYGIRGNPNDFYISSAIGEETIVFSPYYLPKETEEIRTTVNQTLILYESTNYMQESGISRDVIKMSPENKAYHKMTHLTVNGKLKQIPSLNTVEKIVSELRMVAQNVMEVSSKESLTHMKVVTDMIRTSSYEKVENVFATLTKSPSDKKALAITWMVLAHAGTTASTKFILDVCTKDREMVANCSAALTKLSLTAVPNAEMIDQIIEMTGSSITEVPAVKMSLYLTLGSFAHKLRTVQSREVKTLENENLLLNSLVKETDVELATWIDQILKENTKKIKEISETGKTVSEKIMKMFTNLLMKDSVKDKTLALKAIKNSGLTDAVPVLKTYITDENIKNTMPYTRVMAVWAFSRIAVDSPKRVEAVNFLFEIAMNIEEANEMRTTAFTVLMVLKPDFAVVELIVAKLPFEKDIHFTSYVLTYLEAYANSTYEPVLPISKMATDVLKAAPESKTGMLHSFYKFRGYYNDKFRAGASLKMSSQGSIDRFMNWNFGLNTVMFGQSTSPFGVSVTTQGAASLIKKMYGIKAPAAGKSLHDLLKNKPAFKVNSKQFIQEISSALKMTPREEVKFHGQVSLCLHGQEVHYFESIEDFLHFLIPDGMLGFEVTEDYTEATLPVNIATPMYVADISVSIVTEIGLPIRLQTQVSAAQKINGVAKGRLLTSGNSIFKVDLNTKLVLGVSATMGLDWFGLKPAVGFNGLMKFQSPVNTTLGFKFDEKIMKFTVSPPNQDTPVVETVFEPVVQFVNLFNNTGTPSMRLVTRPIYNSFNQKVSPIAVSLPLPFFAQVIGQAPVRSNYPIPYSPFAGRSEMKFSIKPTEDAPKMISIVAKIAPQQISAVSSKDKDAYIKDLKIDPKSITVPMMIKKILTTAGEPLPVSVKPLSEGFVIFLDASTTNVERRITIEFLRLLSGSLKQDTYFNVFTTPIPGWSNKPWNLLAHYSVNFPRVHVPEDIYSIGWQQNLHEDLKYHTWNDSSKVENAITMTTVTQTTQQEILAVPSASRVLDSLVPSIFFSMTNKIYDDTLLLHSKISEEFKQNLDPNFLERDNDFYDYVMDLSDCETLMMQYLDGVLKSKEPMPLHDLVYAQWIIMKQEHVLSMLFDIVTKYKFNDIITNSDQIDVQMSMRAKMMHVMLEKVETIYKSKGLIYIVPGEGAQVTVPVADSVDWDNLVIDNSTTVEQLLSYVQSYWLLQNQFLQLVQEKMNNFVKIQDLSKILKLREISKKLVTGLDQLMYQNKLIAAPGPAYVVLMTTQNEMMVNMWQCYMGMIALAGTQELSLKPTESESANMTGVDVLLKSLSSQFSMRTSLVVSAKDLVQILQFETKDLREIREAMLWVETDMMVQSSTLIYPLLPANASNWKPEMDKLIKSLDHGMNLVTVAVKKMNQLPSRSHVYHISSIFDAVGRINHVAVLARQKMASLTGEERLRWIHELEVRALLISNLKAYLSTLFTNSIKAEPYKSTQTYKSAPADDVVKALEELIADCTQLLKEIKSHPEMIIKFISEVEAQMKILQKIVHEILSDSKFKIEIPKEILNKFKELRDVVEQLVVTIGVDIFENASKSTQTDIANAMIKIDELYIALKKVVEDVLVVENSSLFTQMFTMIRPQEGIEARLNITWGTDNSMDKNVILDIFASRSAEQTLWLMKQLNPAAMSTELIASIIRRVNGQPIWDDAVMDNLNSYDHINTTLSYKHLPSWMHFSARSWQDYLKAYLWDCYTQHSLAAAKGNSGSVSTIHSSIEISERNNKMALAMTANGEKDVFANIPVYPSIMKSLKPTQAVRSIATKIAKYVSGGYSPATCSVNSRSITTFDLVNYMLPPVVRPCKTVLAMDCSVSKAFVVKRGYDGATASHTVEIAIEDKIIEVKPGHDVTQVKVDDKIVDLPIGRPVNLPTITLINKGSFVQVELTVLGVQVNVNRESIDVQVSEMFKNEMCGLCGNFDGQSIWEFEGPRQEIFRNKTAFAMTYVVPDSACPASKFKFEIKRTDLYNIPKPMHIDYTKIIDMPSKILLKEPVVEDSCTVERRTVIKIFKKRNLVCFSGKPITECSLDCNARKVKPRRERIPFKCFDREALTARTLMKAVRRSDAVLTGKDLEEHSRVIYRNVFVEENCQADSSDDGEANVF